MIDIIFKHKFPGQRNLRSLIYLAINKTLLLQGKNPESTGLSILIGDDNYLRELNSRFRGINETTDVLSFEADVFEPATSTLIIGDIAISYPAAERQATNGGYDVDEELALLSIHGTLHLLGYDHDNPESQKIMWALQNQVLSDMDLHILSTRGE